ncbi:MAG: hypothetical protein WCL70_10485 [Paludibacter sp.]
MKNILFLYLIILLLSSCTPRITTSLIKKEKPLSKNSIVVVYDKNDTLPAATKKLGTTRVNDNASTVEFDYNFVVEVAKLEAGKAGGNAIRIIKHQLPNLLNTGHEVYADILKIDTSIVHQRSNQKSKESYIKIPYSHLRFALNGGYAYNLGKDVPTLDTRIQTYDNQMKSGLNFGAEINYFVVNGQMGIGVNYETVSSQNSLSGVTHLNSGQIFSNNKLSDNLNIQYIGPMYTCISRQITKTGIKDALIINVGMGNLSYSDSKIVDLKNYKITGSALGTYYSIGYDRFISKNMALGIQLSLITGMLGNYDRFDGTSTTHIQLDNNSYQSLSHVSLSVGLRFNTSK